MQGKVAEEYEIYLKLSHNMVLVVVLIRLD